MAEAKSRKAVRNYEIQAVQGQKQNAGAEAKSRPPVRNYEASSAGAEAKVQGQKQKAGKHRNLRASRTGVEAKK